MNWQEEKEQLGKELVKLAYECGCIETIFNAKDLQKRKEGWILKNGTNSIYYVNFRKIGGSPKFTAGLGYGMGRVLEEEIRDYDIVIGVEMAGIPIVSAMSTAMYLRTDGRVNIKYGYTRPLPGEKIRTVDESKKTLEELKQKKINLGEWGSHNLIEGDISNGYKVVIGDDMVTDFGSKMIARTIINYEIERLDLKDVSCNKVLVGIDREQGAEKSAKEVGMELHSVVPMASKGMDWLRCVMPEEQYRYLNMFIKEPGLFQDIGRDPKVDKKKGKSSPIMQEALDLASKTF